MAGSGHRRAATAIAVIVLVATAAWLGYEAGVADAPTRETTPSVSKPAHEEAPPRRPRARSDPPTAESAAPAVPAAETSKPATPVAARADESGPTFLEVEVVDPGGLFRSVGQVYALAEGARGVNDGGLLPTAYIGKEKRCRLALPSPGRYDVGAVVMRDAPRHGLALSVVAPSSQPVRVTLSAVAEIRFEDHGLRVDNLSFMSASPDAVRYPGRGQPLLAGDRVSRDASGRLVLTAEVGLQLKAAFWGPPQSPPVLVEPATFAAPAVVEILRGEFVPVKAAFSPPDLRFDVETEIAVRFDWGAGASAVGDAEVRYVVPAGKSLAQTQPYGLARGVVSARRGTLRWSGAAVRPGEMPWDLDQSTTIAATIEVDPASAALKPPTIRIVDPRKIAGPNLRAWQSAADAARRVDQFVPTQTDKPTPLQQGTAYVIAWDLVGAVAGPVKVGAGETALELKPAGWLVVVPERISDLGQPRLCRADDAPFIAFNPVIPGDAMMREIRLSAGQRLGPFEPGDVAFVVETSDGKRREVRATIRAGCCTALAVPSCPVQ